MKKNILLIISLFSSLTMASECDRIFEEIAFFKPVQDMCFVYSDLPMYQIQIENEQIFAESIELKCGKSYTDEQLNSAYNQAKERVYNRIIELVGDDVTEKEFCQKVATEYYEIQKKYIKYPTKF
ncbi:hypothetical protein [Avibacterium paragallinarum]|uniref:Uncharacterized protein n=1 Tax=Avibacterium paragallinarum TaxID=728 RepID=A0ABU7QS16_AVIPA|nr:hypothetical protein [Avibacterium paragallinarum]